MVANPGIIRTIQVVTMITLTPYTERRMVIPKPKVEGRRSLTKKQSGASIVKSMVTLQVNAKMVRNLTKKKEVMKHTLLKITQVHNQALWYS